MDSTIQPTIPTNDLDNVIPDLVLDNALDVSIPLCTLSTTVDNRQPSILVLELIYPPIYQQTNQQAKTLSSKLLRQSAFATDLFHRYCIYISLH